MLPSLLQRIEHTAGMLRGYQYLRGASARVPDLNLKNTEWWARERREGTWGVNDERVNDMAKRLGFDSVIREDPDDEIGSAGGSERLGSGPGRQQKPPLRLTARKAAQDFMKSFTEQKIHS